LSKHTACQILDFFHASEYVTKVAEAIYPNKNKRSKWLSGHWFSLIESLLTLKISMLYKLDIE